MAKASKATVPAPQPEYDNPFGDGTLYANKDELSAKRLVFDVTQVSFETGKGFEGADRWSLIIEVVQNGEIEEQVLTFGCNDKRDVLMTRAQEILEAGRKLPPYILVKSGRAFYLNAVKQGSAPKGTSFKQNPEANPYQAEVDADEIPF